MRKRELFEAINYYDECQEGLGFEFAREIYSTIQRIIHFPEAWSKLSKIQEDALRIDSHTVLFTK